MVRTDQIPPPGGGPSVPVTPTEYQTFRPKTQPLHVFFRPRTVAVIGASDLQHSVGRKVLWNLLQNPFGGTVFPVSGERASVLGIQAFKSPKAVPEKIDLAILALPVTEIPQGLDACVDAGVRGALLLPSDFKESDPAGRELEDAIRQHARRGMIRVIGHNSLGVMAPNSGLNATIAGSMARPGSVAFISQSGSLCSAVLDWSLRELVGFSALVSVGSMVDVGWGDLIEYLGDDPRTKSILVYMEHIRDARGFLSAAREVSLAKPIILIKPERTGGLGPSWTETGLDDDQVYDAAFRRCGVLRVNQVSDLFYMAEVLAKQPRPQGNRLAIVTNAGGPGILAANSLVGAGGRLAEFSDATVDALDASLPVSCPRTNPVDLQNDADPGRFRSAVDLLAKDPGTDGLLVILTPQAMTDPDRTAELLAACAATARKPVLASWMGGARAAGGENVLNRANIPTFPYPDTAARAFHYMWRYSYNLRALYETPVLSEDSIEFRPDRSLAGRVIENASRGGRTQLTEEESNRLLSAYGIQVVTTRVAGDVEEAVHCAESVGYPVVLKTHSQTVRNKSEAGGVHLNLPDPDSVRRAFRSIRDRLPPAHPFEGVSVQPMLRRKGLELSVGCLTHPILGPVLVFGEGGIPTHLTRDRALGLPPLNTTLALRLMERTHIYQVVKALSVSGEPAALSQLLVRFSLLVVEQRRIREVEVNPIFVSPEGVVALEARVQLHDPALAEDALPKLAIRPYPTQYMSQWRARDGSTVTIRPIRPEDELLMVRFHETLSDQTVYYRYFHPMRLSQRVAHERLIRICFIDYDREIALVAQRRNPDDGTSEIMGVGRLIRIHGTTDAEFAVLVSDRYQRSGLGTEVLRQLLQVGRQEKIRRILGDILPDNRGMQRVCEKLGFGRSYDVEEGVVKVEYVV